MHPAQLPTLPESAHLSDFAITMAFPPLPMLG
jgi:hypothetical protein